MREASNIFEELVVRHKAHLFVTRLLLEHFEFFVLTSEF
jgi:hypothetical protein